MNSIIDKIADDLSLDKSYISSIIRRSYCYYKTYSIPKRNGGTRIICQASPELKSLQYWVKVNVLNLLPVSSSSYAYKTGDSIRRHAYVHSNSNFIFHTDIKDFFPSINAKMLTDILQKHYQELKNAGVWFGDTCSVIEKICFRNNKLSIGTVSSPAISNIIAYDFDEWLSSYCEKHEFIYSRYADDIYISSRRFIPMETKNTVNDQLLKHGFVANPSKTWFKSKKCRRKVTGLVITDKGRISVGTATRNRLKKMIYNRLVHGIGSPDVILGYLAYLKDVEPRVYNQYIIKYSTYCNGDVISAIKNGPSLKSTASIHIPEI